ncbi:MAG: response regulator transcription factor [Gemmatimonadota bacterium]|nr:response regulator transcription factor [Gemmatimonadota bacterium]HEU4990258.1 response regulator transcription factor [Gemmatimonadaceae bacterium]
MTDSQLRVLMLEDSEADGELIELALRRGTRQYITRRVATRDAFVAALRDFVPDVVLSDHSLHTFNAPAAMHELRAHRPTAPLIVVSGALDERMAVSCIRAGAEDLVLKSHLHRLVPSIEAALATRQRLDTLSPRQLEVLRLVAEGHTTREIAERLGISDKTVETHRGEIMKRTGIHDAVSLVRYAVRMGLVPLAD